MEEARSERVLVPTMADCGTRGARAIGKIEGMSILSFVLSAPLPRRDPTMLVICNLQFDLCSSPPVAETSTESDRPRESLLDAMTVSEETKSGRRRTGT